MLTIASNTTDTAIVVDEAGFTIEGRFWGVIDTLDPRARVELESGRVLKLNETSIAALEAAGPDHDRYADIQAVLAALADRIERREAAEAMEKDELLDEVDDVDRLEPGGDGVPHKDDLVDTVVAEATADGTDVGDQPDPAPETPAKKTSSRAAAKK